MMKVYPDRTWPAILRARGDLVAIAWTVGWARLGWLVYRSVLGLEVVADGITNTGKTFDGWIESFRHAVPGGIPYLTQFLLDEIPAPPPILYLRR